MSSEFNLTSYIGLLNDFVKLGYRAVGFDQAVPDQRHLILRHDIDMSIQAAREMAEHEASEGFASTYFVLLRTELYNAWSDAAVRDLSAIRNLGHEIGLHLDASLYPEDSNALEAAAGQECTILESLLSENVRFISFHRPAKKLLGRSGLLAGRQHAYQPKFFSEMGYCSDSQGAWRHGAPLDHPAVADGKALQLLTHPIWWIGRSVSSQQKLVDFLEHRLAQLDRSLAENCGIYKSSSASNTLPSNGTSQ